MSAENSIYPGPDTLCDGKGWIKNKENATGWFACRGCTSCGFPRIGTVAAPKLQLVKVKVDGRPYEIPDEEDATDVPENKPELPVTENTKGSNSNSPSAPAQTVASKLPLESYRAPDALPKQLPLPRIGHSIEDVEKAGGYSLIYSQPPWSSDRLSLTQLRLLEVSRIAAKDSALFLWAPASAFPHALGTIEAWGFEFKAIAFFCTGTKPKWCLLGVRGKPPVKSVLKPMEMKPAEGRGFLHEVLGDLPAIELFAKDRVEFMDAWGPDLKGGSDVALSINPLMP